MIQINPKEISLGKLQQCLTALVAPRPIAFASTIDKAGNNNLSPFSFFNIFSNNPPMLVFSPARRVRDNTTKHSYQNVLEVPEVVINMVNYEMVQQASLASTEYPKGVDEFIKSGFTAIDSMLVKPKRVKESPVQLECLVKNVFELGSEGGAGILVMAEIVMIHLSENVMIGDKISQDLLRLVGRLGENWYCKAFGDSLFEIEKPLTTLGIGVDQIPNSIRNSKILTGNNLGQLGNIEKIPSMDEAVEFTESIKINELTISQSHDKIEMIHELAKKYLEMNKVKEAWMILLSVEK
ncbi:MAG: flavin reductase family protein [Bacteroidota bacterium]|jgi:flavin reductase (DIM6/NTAB) family NADH-FMN oxidoreductase RutF